MVRSAALVAAIALAASAAQAADWVYVAENASGDRMYVDRSAKRDLDNIWVKTDFSKPDRDGATSSKLLYAISCADRTYTAKAGAWYFPNGAVQSSPSPPRIEAKPIIPDSVFEAVFNLYCPSK